MKTLLALAVMLSPLAPHQEPLQTPAADTADTADQGPLGGYLVVPIGLEHADPEHVGFAAVAAEVAAFHGGRVAPFDGSDWSAWSKILDRERPDEVLFVVPPETLDIVLHRRLLLSSVDRDDDPLVDFTFGYFTARNAAALKGLWARTKAVHEHGLANRTWRKLGVTFGIKSRVYDRFISDVALAAGFEGDASFVAIVEDDPDQFDFLDDRLPEFENASVIEISGNGDPEGIWLFSDRRNLDRSAHWTFAADRVGEDPEGVMPRLLASRIAALELRSPVVWSGTCHSAATHRVFVEGDIVSTFGTTDEHTLYEMPMDKSLCLSVLDAGAVAYLAPIGANHGMSASREGDFALVHGATLGEAIKSTYDDVLLAAGRAPALTLPVVGRPYGVHEPVMQGGGCNRILIGDPALRPFEASGHPSESVATQRVEGGWEVIVDWRAGWHSWAWDMFGTDRSADWRVIARVPLNRIKLGEAGAAPGRILVRAKGEGDEALRYSMRHAVVETWRGERWLHLQANGPRGEVERKAARVTFQIADGVR